MRIKAFRVGGCSNRERWRAKWDLALILGWIFILAAAAVVVTGLGWLATSTGDRRPTPREAEGI